MFGASKSVLAASSEFFHNLFSDDICEEDDGIPASEYRLPVAVTSAGLAQVLNCLHSRLVDLSLANVWQVTQAADFLLVSEVTETCSRFLS